MENNIDIFCEFSFLEKFFNSCPQSAETIFHGDYKNWKTYFDLLCGPCDMRIIDIKDDDFNNYCNGDSLIGQMFLVLLSSCADGKNLVCLPDERNNMETSISDGDGKTYFKDEHAIFFLDRSKENCKGLEEDYGLMFISNENIYDYTFFLFIPDIKEINENSVFWDCMSKYSHPCNTIVLIDGYIATEVDQVIEDNLKSIFDALLPLKLNKSEFCIHIFTLDNDDTTKNKRIEQMIQQLLQSLRSYPIYVKITFEHNLEHDRYLFTNYCLFNSGYGFVLTKSKRKRGTNLSFFPICHYSTFSSKNNAYQIVQNLKRRRKIT